MFIKNKDSNDYTGTTMAVYSLISSKYGYTARISDIWKYLLDAFGMSEWGILDPKLLMNGSFDAYMMDNMYNWLHGQSIDFSELRDAIFTAGDFTVSEKSMFEMGNVEERLWGIFLAIMNPELDLNNNKINNI